MKGEKQMETSPISYGQMQKNIQDCLEKGLFLDRATVAEAADALVLVLKQRAFFQYDIVTGLYRVTASTESFRECTEREAQSLFNLVVAPLVRIITNVNMDGGHKARKLTTAESTELWDAVKFSNTIDSRREEYDAIPAWDGTPRIATFMQKYFECDCMPNLFLLFITSVMAKWRSPKVHVPYWFDFVGDAKGTGKSSLMEHLFGERAMILPLPSRQEDLFVSAYTNGALVVVDDECTWIGKAVNKFTYDQFKSLVTMQKDTFSRKHAQPETHDRPFVIVRTSNEPRTVFSTNERRQIIFNVGLSERECRHWNLSEANRIQLLAEAKDYVEKHNGEPYRLSKEEEDIIEQANMDNFDTESEGYESIYRFLRDLQNRPADTAIYQIPNPKGNVCTRYINYTDWCKDNHIKYIDDSRVFNRQMLAVARINPTLVKYTGKKERCGEVISRIARIVIKNEEVEDDIPDMF